MLAEIIGTTRSGAGNITYSEKLEIHGSLLNVVLHDKPESRKNDARNGPR
jgi:hypothetical protein